MSVATDTSCECSQDGSREQKKQIANSRCRPATAAASANLLLYGDVGSTAVSSRELLEMVIRRTPSPALGFGRDGIRVCVNWDT